MTTLPMGNTLEANVHNLDEQVTLLNTSEVLNIDDKYLLFSDEDQHGAFKIFSIPDITFLYSWGRQGGGPDEFRVIPLSELSARPGGFSLYDIGSQKLKQYSINDTTIQEIYSGDLKYEGQTNTHTQITAVSDDLYIAEYGKEPGDDNFEFIALQPDKNESEFKFGKYPNSELEGFERYFEYFKSFEAATNGQRLASFYLYHNRIKIFNSEGGIIHDITIDDPYISDKESIAGSFQYRTLEAASNNYLYALGIYKNRENMENINTYFEIWDWEGNQVHRAQFDQPIHNFSVSESDGKIYAYSKIEAEKIYEYVFEP